MTLTLLVDLDNTLLENDMDVFLPAYIQALSRYLSPKVDPKLVVTALLAGTRRMVEHPRPDCTLLELFNEVFYPPLGTDPKTLQPAIEEFYENVFPSLKTLTQPVPKAVQVIESAFERGYRVVVATSPLFPATAIHQRLEWAGLPVDQYPFELVTTVEDFHFAKPNPAYLAECLALMGWPEGPVVMVGDDLVNDIRAARSLGLASYWTPTKGARAKSEDLPTASGPLSGLLGWLDSTSEEDLLPDYSARSAMLAILLSTPAVLDGLLRRSPETAWSAHPQPEEWSLTEILCHLRDVEEEVNFSRLQQVLKETNPFLPGRDTDVWAEERQYFCQDAVQALQRFFIARLKVLDLLESLPPLAWERSARHAILGNTRLQELVNIIASHDRLHVQQAIASVS